MIDLKERAVLPLVDSEYQLGEDYWRKGRTEWRFRTGETDEQMMILLSHHLHTVVLVPFDYTF